MKYSVGLRVALTAFAAASVAACGGGGGGGGGESGPDGGPEAVAVSNDSGAVKGPMQNAQVGVWVFDPAAPDGRGAMLGAGRTDEAARVVDVTIPADSEGYLLFVFQADAETRDLTTGAAPVIPTLETLVTADRVLDGEAVYATPLSSAIAAIAKAKAGDADFGGDGSAPIGTLEVAAAIGRAQQRVRRMFGFGLLDGLDVLATPPLLIAGRTDPATEQEGVARLRTASEGLAALSARLAESLDTSAGRAAGTTSVAGMFGALVDDAIDGRIDGIGASGDLELYDAEEAAALADVIEGTDPGTLSIPGDPAQRRVSDSAQILVDERAATGNADAETDAAQSADTTTEPGRASEEPEPEPENAAPAFTSGNSVTVAEGETATGYTAEATDPDGDTLSYAIGGGEDGALFQIDAATGVLAFRSPQDFEGPGDADGDNDYQVVLSVADGAGGTDTLSLTVRVSDVNEAPSITSGDSASLLENETDTGYVLTGMDPDGDVLSYILAGGADADRFRLEEQRLFFVTAPDFENPQDADGDNLYEVLLAVEDEGGEQAAQEVTVTVQDRNEAPSFTSGGAVSVEENRIETGYTATATDPEGDTLSFSVAGGDDAAGFQVDAASGVMRFAQAPDFEAPADADGDNVYLVTLQVADPEGLTATRNVAVTVTDDPDDENRAPEFVSGTTASVLENREDTGYQAQADDPDGDTVSYALSGGSDRAALSIDAATGVLRFVAAPDFENPSDSDADNTFEVTISASDGNGGEATQAVAVSVTDQSQLEATVDFPVSGANLGGSVDQIGVSGRLRDLEDGEVRFEDVDYIDVNGQRATIDPDTPDRWHVRAPVARGTDAIGVVVASTSGDMSSRNVAVENTPLINQPLALDFLPGEGTFVADSGTNSVYRVGSGGQRFVISDRFTGSGLRLESPVALTVDAANDRALVLDAGLDALLAVDLTNGDRTVLSGQGTGSGPALEVPGRGLVLDAAAGRVFLSHAPTDEDAVLSIDLATGDRSVLSSSELGVGGGQSFVDPASMVLDGGQDRLLLCARDANFNEFLLAVALDSGERSLISGGGVGAGPEIDSCSALVKAQNEPVAWLGEGLDHLVLRVDLANGDRSLYSGPTVGSGPDFQNVAALTRDEASGELITGDGRGNRLFRVDSSGNREVFSIDITGNGPQFNSMAGMAFDAPGDALYVPDTRNAQPRVLALDSTTGDRSVASGPDRGVGDGPFSYGGLAHDGSGERVIGFSGRAVYEVDLATGDRGVLSDCGADDQNPGLLPNEIAAIAPDPMRGQVVVVGGVFDHYLASVSLADGSCELVSSAFDGSGPEIERAASVAVDGTAGIAYVGGDGKLFSVDLATGERENLTDLSGGDIGTEALAFDAASGRVLGLRSGTGVSAYDINSREFSAVSGPNELGPFFKFARSIVADGDRRRAFVNDNGLEGVVVIDLVSGDRAIVSK